MVGFGAGSPPPASNSSAVPAPRSGCTGVPARTRSVVSAGLTASGWGSYLAPVAEKRSAIALVKRSTIAGSTEPTSARQTVVRSTTRCTRSSNRFVCVPVRAVWTCLPRRVSLPVSVPALARNQRPTQGDSARWTHCALATMARAMAPGSPEPGWTGWLFATRRDSGAVVISSLYSCWIRALPMRPSSPSSPSHGGRSPASRSPPGCCPLLGRDRST